MEQIRQNIIVLNYGLLHIRKRRHDASEYIEKARPAYKEYVGLRRQRAEKEKERRALSNELKRLPVLNISRRRELKARIAELSEDIEELQNSEMNIVHGFGKVDARGMKGIPSYLSTVEANVQKMDEQETQYTGDIEKAKHDFDELRVQAAGLDQDELTGARLALRPQMERAARARIQSGLSSGRINFWHFEGSKNDADRWLDEEGMAERHEARKRRREREKTYQPQKHKPRSHEQER